MSRLTAAAVAGVLAVFACEQPKPRPKYTAICVHKPSAVRVADERCPNKGKGFVWFYLPAGRKVPAVGKPVDLTRGSWTKPGGGS